MKKIRQILMLLTCIAVVMTAALQRDGKLWGYAFDNVEQSAQKEVLVFDTMTVLDGGITRINTAYLARDVKGYGGKTPLYIYVKEGRILRIEAQKNNETPEFFAEAATLLKAWNGKTLEEAVAQKVDAVSGATLSSNGIIGNVKRGIAYAAKNADEPSLIEQMNFSPKLIAGILVVLMAAILPLFLKNKTYRTVQLILNVIVLGFWSGTFLSWSLFVNFMSNGVSIWSTIIPIIMLIVAFIYPLFGKKNYYCTHICPCGSLQDLAAKAKIRKWRMNNQLVKWLNRFRKGLFVLLMFLMLSGVWTAWMDYEVFAAFIFQAASAVVLILGCVVVALSFFVPRPYCRFVCPTGTLFKLSEGRW